MISGQFTARIKDYLESKDRILDEKLLEEASMRCRESFKRQLMEDRQSQAGRLRMSSAGACVRKQWYSFSGVEPEPFSARAINVFLTGDLLEVSVSVLARLAGWKMKGKSDQQGDEVRIPIEHSTGTSDIIGHIDDLLEYEGETYLVEYKTASSYGYDKFEGDDFTDEFKYLDQASTYASALGLKQFILVYTNKENGKMTDRVYNVADHLVENAKARWSQILNFPTSEPPREYDPVPEKVYNRKTRSYDYTGRTILSTYCSFCNFKKNCYPNLEVEVKSGKPVFLIPNLIGDI